MAAVLNRLSLSTAHSRTLSLSKESRELVQRFNLILKDIVNGAPTAYDDLVQLFDSSEDHLEKSYRHLPPHLQKLVKTLPKKLSKDIVPELLAGGAAAEVASKEHAGGKAKNSAVQMPNLKDLIIKQGAISALLKSVMNVLKLRFPAFMGTSALWSLGVFGPSFLPFCRSFSEPIFPPSPDTRMYVWEATDRTQIIIYSAPSRSLVLP